MMNRSLATAFQLQQEPFPFQSSGIAGQTAVCPDDPVAGNQQGDGIMSHCTPYRLGRHLLHASLMSHFPRQFFVSDRLSIRNLLKQLPYGATERGIFPPKRRHKAGTLAPEILL